MAVIGIVLEGCESAPTGGRVGGSHKKRSSSSLYGSSSLDPRISHKKRDLFSTCQFFHCKEVHGFSHVSNRRKGVTSLKGRMMLRAGLHLIQDQLDTHMLTNLLLVVSGKIENVTMN